MPFGDMHPKVARAFEEIDAAVFSGDTFEHKRNREKLEQYVQRWQRWLNEEKKDA